MKPRFEAGDSDLPFHAKQGRVHRAQICTPPDKWVRIEPGASADLHIEGTGVLRRLWCVFNAEGSPSEAMKALTERPDLYRNVWIHITFDEHPEAQVSAPLADFFLFGHGDVEDIDSEYLQVVRIPPLDRSPYQGALTCFAPMPFQRCAKVCFVNGNDIPVRLVAGFDWLEVEHAAAPLYFHARYTHRQCRREPMVILDQRAAEGTFVGLGLYVNNGDRSYRWHEGHERFTIDGARPPVRGTGAEDYFCLAWGFRRLLSRPLFGVTCLRPEGGSPSLPQGGFNPAGEFAMYRFHRHDWVNFRRSLRLSFAAVGKRTAESPLPLEFRSVAFWYGRDRGEESSQDAAGD